MKKILHIILIILFCDCTKHKTLCMNSFEQQLELAIQENNTTMAIELVESEHIIFTYDYGYKMLNNAIENNNINMINILLSHNAISYQDIFKYNGVIYSPFLFELQNKYSRATNVIRSTQNTNIEKMEMQIALLYAANNHFYEEVNILKNKCNIHYVLAHACANELESASEVLKKLGAKIDVALLYASYQQFTNSAIRLLINKYKANVESALQIADNCKNTNPAININAAFAHAINYIDNKGNYVVIPDKKTIQKYSLDLNSVFLYAISNSMTKAIDAINTYAKEMIKITNNNLQTYCAVLYKVCKMKKSEYVQYILETNTDNININNILDKIINYAIV